MPQQTIRDKRTQRVYRSGQWALRVDLPTCDVCTGDKKGVARFDAKSASGRWGFFCPTHFVTLECGLGLGVGQRLFREGEYEVVANTP